MIVRLHRRHPSVYLALLSTLAGASLACSSSKNEGTPADAGADGTTGGDPTDASDGSALGTSDALADASTAGPPPEILANAKEWPTANHDFAGTRASQDTKINASNVATLTEAWHFELPGGGFFGAATAEPLVSGGTVYYVDMRSNVFALDFKTGVKRWEKSYDSAVEGPNGVAVGWGKVFVASGQTSFVALAADTGSELWKAPIVVPINGGIDMEPAIYDGKVYVATVPLTATTMYVGGAAGMLYGLDQATGAISWSFDTVDSADIWGNAPVNSGGGAWYAPTIDTATGAMFWGTGNPGPYPGTGAYPSGTSRPGDNLYSSSVVSLKHDTGALTWYHQEKKHDILDHDFQNPPVLASVSIAGAVRDLAIGSGKTGTVTALDRTTGQVVWHTPVGVHMNDDITEIPEAGIVVEPGDLGGVETPLAYANGMVFVAVVNWPLTYFPASTGDHATNSTGALVALDAATGAVRWQAELTSPAFGAATVANDVVLTSTFDGQVVAFSTATGAKVWSYQSPIGINAPLVVVDDTLIVAAGSGVGVPKIMALRLP